MVSGQHEAESVRPGMRSPRARTLDGPVWPTERPAANGRKASTGALAVPAHEVQPLLTHALVDERDPERRPGLHQFPARPLEEKPATPRMLDRGRR